MDLHSVPLLSHGWDPGGAQQEEPPLPPAVGIGSLPGYANQHPEYSLDHRRQDLTRICQRLRNREYYFGGALIPDETIESLDQTQIHDALQALTSKVKELAQRVRLSASDQNRPEFILRSPPHLYQLFYLVDFSGMQVDSQAFFQNKGLVARVLAVFKQQVEGTTQVLRMADEFHIAYSRKTPTHIRLTSALIEKLNEEVDSVEFLNELLEHTVVQSSNLVKERLSLLPSIRRYIKIKIDDLSHFFSSSLLLSFQGILSEETPFDQEQQWLTAIAERFETMKPYLRIVECIQEFLSPYLGGSISFETEDRGRPEICQWLIPTIRSEFPNFDARDEEIETIALSTYLGIGARGLDLQRYTTMLADCAQTEGFNLTLLQPHTRRLQRTLLKDYPLTQQALEGELIVAGGFRLYRDALRHSLRIDFRSLNLLDIEIELLAENQCMNPGRPLGSEWRTELGIQLLSRDPQ
jgi:hypothetical protein